MENEDGYMVLNFKNHIKFRQRSSDLSQYLHYYGLTVVVGCIGTFIFILTVIGLNFQEKEMNFYQNINISSLAGNKHKCPNDWLLNRRKCYWFSTSFKTWKESQHDCTKLQAHLLVIQNLDELIFVQSNLKPGRIGWIGLYIKSQGDLWTWVDEHFLVPQLFSVIGPTDNKSCAIITGSRVYSEDCGNRFNGICQKDAV